MALARGLSPLPIPHSDENCYTFLQQAETLDYLELVQAFRNWVRSQLKK